MPAILDTLWARWATFLWIPIILASCGGTEEMTTVTDMQGSLIASADAELTSDRETEAPVLRTTLIVQNVGTEAVELHVLSDCPVAVELREAGEADLLVFDGGAEPCTRKGQLVRLEPGDEHEFVGVMRLERLQGSGVTAGRYDVVAILATAAPRLRVDAGQIVLTNLR